MIAPTIPQPIVAEVLSPLGVVAAEAMPPGMSGASVYRCELRSSEALALKCWPEGTLRERVTEIHRVIQHARNGGCELIPKLVSIPDRSETVITHHNRHWDLMQWMPGAPSDIDASTDQIRLGAAAIAQFHESVHELNVRHQPPPAVAARLRRLRELDTLVPKFGEVANTRSGHDVLSEAVSAAAGVVGSKWGEARLRIARSLQKYERQNALTQYVLRDIHRGHLLFAGGDPSGLIDFDAVRIDTPATDLARWAGSFLSGRLEAEEVWNAALAGFRDVYSLNGRSRIAINRDFAVEICFATTWISLVNWLDWIRFQQRSFPPGPTAVASRLKELTRIADRLESHD